MTEDKRFGICIGEASPTRVTFISKAMPASGEYVSLEYDGKRVLGMVESVVRGSPSISEDLLDPELVEKILSYEGEDEQYLRGEIRILGDVDDLKIPRVPPPPGTVVHKAEPEVLRKVFGEGSIKIGRLLSSPEVEVWVDCNTMLTRHLAILAITGAGKSNTVSVIVNGILELHGLPIIFDLHSEYVEAGFTGGVKKIIPKLNPIYLSSQEFRLLVDVGKEAHLQERYLRRAYSMAKKKVSAGGARDFIFQVQESLKEMMGEETERTQAEKKALIGVLNKVEDFGRKYRNLVDPYAGNLLDALEQGRANVVDLGQVDEEYADVIVSHILRKLLHLRKNKSMPPAFCVLEEAHILAPNHRPTLSKYWIDRIAREGRKFGLGLCLVSQRPKSLDPNSLSQANNTIIMRLVEPSDQRHVQQASERLSDDLLSQLSSLNIGEAVVLGLMTKVPALVKIDKFKGKLGGGDPDVVGEWRENLRKNKTELEEGQQEVEDLYSGMEDS
jgi:hypothetical protein